METDVKLTALSLLVRPIRSSILCALLVATNVASAAPGTKCNDPEFRQFDFWVGDWDSFDIDDGKESAQSIARNHVDSILNGCVVHEDYVQFNGLHGESFTIFDRARNVWHQSWVTNGGVLWLLEGTRKGSRITLEGDTLTFAGRKQRVRIFWEPQGADVRETATASEDDGKTFTPLFDVVFRKHKS
jgi:hypothetical protein